MGDQDAWAYLLEKLSNSICIHFDVNGAGVRCHLAEILIQRFRITGELHAGKEVGPDSESECAEPLLFIRNRSQGFWLGAPPRIAATWLVNHIHAETAPQENVLIPLATIRRGLPCL